MQPDRAIELGLQPHSQPADLSETWALGPVVPEQVLRESFLNWCAQRRAELAQQSEDRR